MAEYDDSNQIPRGLMDPEDNQLPTGLMDMQNDPGGCVYVPPDYGGESHVPGPDILSMPSMHAGGGLWDAAGNALRSGLGGIGSWPGF